MSNDDDLNALRNAARADAAATDLQLQNELASLCRMTRGQLEALRPRLATDDATFNRLVQVVEQATADNVAIAEFVSRVKTLGVNALAVARRASGLLAL